MVKFLWCPLKVSLESWVSMINFTALRCVDFIGAVYGLKIVCVERGRVFGVPGGVKIICVERGRVFDVPDGRENRLCDN